MSDEPPRPQAQPVVVVKKPYWVWTSGVGYGCLAIAAVLVLVAVTAWCNSPG